jgi:hypothetical protein
MNPSNPSSGLTQDPLIELYFLEHRAKLIDIAAYLDRLERAAGGRKPDFRLTAFERALAVLSDGRGQRARRVLEVFSDPTEEPLASAAGMKGAYGAYLGTNPS